MNSETLKIIQNVATFGIGFMILVYGRNKMSELAKSCKVRFKFECTHCHYVRECDYDESVQQKKNPRNTRHCSNLLPRTIGSPNHF